MIYVEDKTFKGENFSLSEIEMASYENCHFIECQFMQTDLSNRRFIDCTFELCDMSMAKLSKSAWRNTKFKDCKMLGLLFDECESQGFEVGFHTCMLNHSSFMDMRLKKTRFEYCQLIEVDFSATDLTNCGFIECELSGSKFQDSNLTNTDLSTSRNVIINPAKNTVSGMSISPTDAMTMLELIGIVVKE